jgi:hypothetical protein
MRTKGALGSVPISLALLNQMLKPNAKVMVSKRFAEAMILLNGNSEEEEEAISIALKNLPRSQDEEEVQISVETY